MDRDLTDRREQSIGSAFSEVLAQSEEPIGQQANQRLALQPSAEDGEPIWSTGAPSSGAVSNQPLGAGAKRAAASQCKVQVDSFPLHGSQSRGGGGGEPKFAESTLYGTSIPDDDGADGESVDAESSSRPTPHAGNAPPAGGMPSKPQLKRLDTTKAPPAGGGSSAADSETPVSPIRRGTRMTRAVRRGSNADPLQIDWRKSNLRQVCQMRHPNIVHLFGISVLENVSYCVVRVQSSPSRGGLLPRCRRVCCASA